MKTSIIVLGLLVSGLAASLLAQDPGYKVQEPRRTLQATEPSREDTRDSVGKINSMEVLDDQRPLRIGDTISLRIVEDRDRVQSLMVQASGDIQAPHIGLVKAVGKTCKALAVSMKRDLERQWFQQATVIVALEREAPRAGGGVGPIPQAADNFTIYGQVGRQGKYEIVPEEELTISQAILRAGGFSQFAQKSKVKIIRKTPKGNVTIFVNLVDIMERGKLEKDIPMRANDVIIVIEKWLNF
jgi:protein involved in polysaccharide export with SLBB domain